MRGGTTWAHLVDSAVSDFQQSQGAVTCGLIDRFTHLLQELLHCGLLGHPHTVALLAHLLRAQVVELHLQPRSTSE